MTGMGARRSRLGVRLLILSGVLLVLLVTACWMMSIVLMTAQEQASTTTGCEQQRSAASGTGSRTADGSVQNLTREEQKNAETILQVGQQLQVPRYGWVIALATAYQESSLRNVDHGDAAGPDSRGLFQQRSAWGPEADRLDPAKATEMFFTGGRQGQSGLLDITGWQDMALGEAAQEIQGSADSTGSWYSEHEAFARRLVAQLHEGRSGEDIQCGTGRAMTCPATDWTRARWSTTTVCVARGTAARSGSPMASRYSAPPRRTSPGGKPGSRAAVCRSAGTSVALVGGCPSLGPPTSNPHRPPTRKPPDLDLRGCRVSVRQPGRASLGPDRAAEPRTDLIVHPPCASSSAVLASTSTQWLEGKGVPGRRGSAREIDHQAVAGGHGCGQPTVRRHRQPTEDPFGDARLLVVEGREITRPVRLGPAFGGQRDRPVGYPARFGSSPSAASIARWNVG